MRPIALVATLLAATAITSCAHQQPAAPPPNMAPPVQPQTPQGPIPGSLEDFRVNVGERVFFAFDRSDLSPEARQILERQAAWLRRYTEVRVLVAGNCDERGTREYNLALGARRAASARDYLVSLGVSPARIDTATDENERLQFQLHQSQAEVARLQSMVSDLAAARDAAAAAPAPTNRRSARASPPPPPPPAPAPEQTAAAVPPPGAEGSLGTLPAGDLPGDSAAAYRNARDLLLNGQTRVAEQAFADFLNRFSNDTNAPDARYWYAFTLLARDANTEAAAAFVDYLRRYPQGPRAPDALVRLGMALKGLGRTAQACRAFADLTSRYPNAARATRDSAVRESRAMNCPRG